MSKEQPTFYILALCGFGDILSHITRLPAVKKAWPGYKIKWFLGGFGKSPQFSKEQLEREGYEASIIKNLTFHNQLPAMRDFMLSNVVKPGDKFEDWSFCEEIFNNQEPVFSKYEMTFPYFYFAKEDITYDSNRCVIIHPITKSGNAEGFEHDVKNGRFLQQHSWFRICELLGNSKFKPTFVGMGDEDFGCIDFCRSKGIEYVDFMGYSVEDTVHIIKQAAGCIATNSWDWEIACRAQIPTVAFYTKNHFFVPVHIPNGKSNFWDTCFIETDNEVIPESAFNKFVHMFNARSRPKVNYSVCMITLDDKDVVKRTIDNVRNNTDEEFVVVDGGSTDGTVEILQESENVTLFHKKWSDDFAYQKNYSLNKASNEWRVWIDADETYETIFWQQLPWYIWESEINDISCIYVPRINTIEGLTNEEFEQYIRQQGWFVSGFRWINYPDYQQRIFRSECEFVGRSHERIIGYKNESALKGQHILHPKTKSRQQRGLDREKHLYETEAQRVYDRIMEGEE